MIERMSLPRRRSFARSAPTFILKWLKPALRASFVNWAIFSSEYPAAQKIKSEIKNYWAVVRHRGDLATLQTSHRPGIYTLEIEGGWKTVSQRRTHPCERTVASRWPSVASFALRIASASSGVIASVIYRNVADFTNSSWTGKK